MDKTDVPSAADRGSEFSDGLGPELSAGSVAAGTDLYRVAYAHAHSTLKVGDLVRMVEDQSMNNHLLRTDWTLHHLADKYGQYVHLRLVLMEAMA